MECPVCHSDSPEDKKFCAECGAELPQPEQVPKEEPPAVAEPAEPKPRWISTHRKGLAATIVALVVVIASVGLIFTQPWSKIKVLTSTDRAVDVDIYIDDELVAHVSVSSGGWKAVGVWSVTAGSHTVSLDAGSWYYTPSVWVPETWDWWSLSYVGGYWTTDYWTYVELDGILDYTFVYEVGPLDTKDAYIPL